MMTRGMGELPEGWSLVPLMTVASLIRGVSYKRGEDSESMALGLVPLLRANNIRTSLSLSELKFVPASCVSSSQYIQPGDVVVALSSGSKAVVGKTVQVRDNWFGTFGAFCGVLRPLDQIDQGYFGYYFQTAAYRSSISEKAAGVNINNIKREHFESFQIPVPPLPEQHRIVAKVDELLAQVNAVRARLARVPVMLKSFRQAVLAAACSGRLTEEWRDLEKTQSGVHKTLGEVLRVSSGKFLPAKQMDAEGRIPVFGGNGITGYHSKSNVDQQTLVIGRVGYYCGSVHLTPPAAWVTDNALIVKHDTSILFQKYLYHALQAMDLRRNESSTAQPAISGQKIYPLVIWVPSISEQNEIVRRVESLFALADKIEARVTAATARADKLTQAILAKAFRGELVPTEAELGRLHEPSSVESAGASSGVVSKGGKKEQMALFE